MKRVLFVSTLGLLLAATTSFAQDVRYNFDKNTDFSKFRTYRWVIIKDAPTANDLVTKQIREAVENELATKGLTKIDDDSANLFIGYQAGVSQEKEFTSFNSNWGYGGGWYGGGWYGPGGGMTTGSTSTIYVGQLAVDMYDSANHDLVWRGVASKTLDPKAKPEKQQKNMAKAVKKLLKNYPPVPKQ
jgi:Domain of unknown function (DUF4136)